MSRILDDPDFQDFERRLARDPAGKAWRKSWAAAQSAVKDIRSLLEQRRDLVRRGCPSAAVGQVSAEVQLMRARYITQMHATELIMDALNLVHKWPEEGYYTDDGTAAKALKRLARVRRA